MTLTLGTKKKLSHRIVLPALVVGVCVLLLLTLLLQELISGCVLSQLYGGRSTFFPDGNRIALSVPANNRQDKGIYIFSRESKELTRLTYPDYCDNYPIVSVDGQKIVFSRGSKFKAALWIMDADDGFNALQLTSPPLFHVDYGASFSPTGKRVAFFRGAYKDVHNLMLLDMETGNVICLKNEVPYLSRNIIWKNEDDIYFFSPEGYSSRDNVNIVNRETGMFQTITAKGSAKYDVSIYKDISFSTNQELLIQCPQKNICINCVFENFFPMTSRNSLRTSNLTFQVQCFVHKENPFCLVQTYL